MAIPCLRIYQESGEHQEPLLWGEHLISGVITGPLSIPTQGGIESDADYPYCSGDGKCFPCVPAGWNNTRCGPPPLYCNKTQSCPVKLDKSNFIAGLKIKDWVAVLVCSAMYIATCPSLLPLSFTLTSIPPPFFSLSLLPLSLPPSLCPSLPHSFPTFLPSFLPCFVPSSYLLSPFPLG